MKTVQIVVFTGTVDTKTITVTEDGEEVSKEIEVKHWDVVKEFEVEDEDQKMLRKCLIRAEILNKDKEGQYLARIKPTEA